MLHAMARLPAWLLITALIAGCASKGAPPTRFYVLGPVDTGGPPLTGPNPEPVSVEVFAVRLPQYLDRPQIIVRVSDNRLEMAEFHQWGGNLANNMSRTVAQNLTRLLATPEISFFPGRPAIPADVRLEIEVMRFERMPDGRVHLIAQWRLSDGKHRVPIVTRLSELRSAALAPESDLEATVAAMSELLAKLSRLIAAEVIDKGTL